MMNTELQTMEIKDIGQLRTILQEIADQNSTTLNQYLQGYLKHENDLVKKLSQQCIEQISRKQSYLQNVIQFSLHLLQSIQQKQQALTVSNERILFLQRDLNKLMRRLQEMEQENNQYIKRQEETHEVINKLEESRCYLEQLSHRQCQSNTFDDLYQLEGHSLTLNKINFNNNHNKNHLAFTQRTPTLNKQLITIQQHQQKLSIYKSSIDNKSHHINQLQRQIHYLHSQLSSLNNQLQMKQSQLELSQIYYKEKLQIAKSHLSMSCHQPTQINQHDVKSIFKRQLARVESVQSIQSINRSQDQFDPFNNVMDLINQQCAQFHYQRNPHIRRSLMQQFVTDFMFQPQQQDPVYSSQIIHSDSFSQIEDSGRQRKKTISVSTTDIRKTLSRAVQTVNNQDKILVRKTQGNRYIKKDNTLNDSFLGSVASMFTKKIQPKKNYTKNKILKQETKDNKQLSFFDSSIGNMFKGIFDYATKKIVTERIQKKKSYHNANLNHSFLDELKPTKKPGYHKGMKRN